VCNSKQQEEIAFQQQQQVHKAGPLLTEVNSSVAAVWMHLQHAAVLL